MRNPKEEPQKKRLKKEPLRTAIMNSSNEQKE
jgi:hypothetical protein